MNKILNLSKMVKCLSLIKRNILLSLITLLLSNTYLKAQNSFNIIFDQPIVNVVNGQNFTINVRADWISGELDVASIHIDFDITKLQVLSATNSPSSSILPNITIPLDAPSTMNGTGRVRYVAGTTSNFPTADFDVISITFTAIQTGTTQLTFRRPPTPAPNTNAIRSGLNILNSVQNATINISPLGCTTPTATIANTGTCNGQAFDLILSNATGATDWNLIINGTTYNDISVGETITTITPPTENIWPASAPTSTFENDGQPVEVGLKFRSAVNGLVKGIRFFRPSTAGTYTGRLYLKTGANSGTQMAVVTFPVAPADQWQEALFTAPVQISANTTYVVTYHSSSGDYRSTSGYFTSSGVTNGNLTALAEGVDGSNGIYDHQISGGTYPTSSFSSSNYWIDPLFVASNYSYALTSVTDNDGCVNIGSPLQTLSVTSPACSPLPVTLLDLSATPQGKNVILSWTTSSEINNKGFEIQRSADNVLWEGLGFVNGAGTSAIPHSYTYTDNDLFPQRYYYRLKQVDNDANYKFSMTVTVLLTGKGEYSLKQNYPNPFGNETSIQYTVPETGKVKLTVFDVNGRTVKVLVNETRQAGTHAINFYTNKLQPGLYYYKMEAGSFSEVKKMVIQ